MQRENGQAAYPIHAVDGKDLEVAIDVFLNGADMVLEGDRSDREGII